MRVINKLYFFNHLISTKYNYLPRFHILSLFNLTSLRGVQPQVVPVPPEPVAGPQVDLLQEPDAARPRLPGGHGMARVQQ